MRTLRQGTEKLVAIGASTGSTEAIRAILVSLPHDFPAVVITQHMPAGFTRNFAARLNSQCRIEVREARHNDRLMHGHAYIAPGGLHLRVERSGANYVAALEETEPVNRHRPSVEVLFNSVARCVGPNSIGLMLTGMGRDGADAMRCMRDAGAYKIAQDEAPCVVYGMPRGAVLACAIHESLPIQAIAAPLEELLRAFSGIIHRICREVAGSVKQWSVARVLPRLPASEYGLQDPGGAENHAFLADRVACIFVDVQRH